MSSVALPRLPLFRLSSMALLAMLLTGTAFLFMRYQRVTLRGDAFAYGFEISRMLVNFGGMALLSPLIYKTTAWARRWPKLKPLTWASGFIAFVTLYVVFNKVMLFLAFEQPLTSWRGSQKLLLNFSHLLVLFYGVVAYLSWRLLSRKVKTKAEPQAHTNSINLTIDGIEQAIGLNTLDYIQAYDHYLKLYQQGKFRLTRKSLKSILAELPDQFVRIHRSTVVNQGAIQKVVRKRGHYWLVMKDNAELKVSPSYEATVKALIPRIHEK